MKLRLSYSQLDKYLKCPKMYEYSRELEKRVFNWNFFVGTCIHEGMHYTYNKQENLFAELTFFIDSYIECLRIEHFFSPEDEQKLEEWKVIMLGMIYAYNIKYSDFISRHTLLPRIEENEHEFLVDIDEFTTFLIKLDNILISDEDYENQDIKIIKGDKLIHEIKTSRDLTANYVESIQTSLQVANYFHLGNTIKELGFKGIVYDVLQKPSIRVKKNELYQEYLIRLEQYYQEDPNVHLHMEFIDVPKIKKDELINTIIFVSKRIREKDFHKTWMWCNLCDFKKLCMSDDNDEFMLAYKKIERDTNGRAKRSY